MAVPKRRKSHSRVRTARAHKYMTAIAVVTCKKCGKSTLPHRVCPECGYFQGRIVGREEDI